MNLRSRLGIIAIIAFSALVYLFAWSPIFSMKSISVTGTPEKVSSEFIISKTDIKIGQRLARIEPRSIEKSISEISWVEKVSVSRDWLHGRVKIDLTSREAVGLYRGKALDSSGILFQLPGAQPEGLPTVTAKTPKLGLVAIELFTSLPDSLRDSLLTISAASESSVSSWQEESNRTIKVTWGSTEDIDFKVSVYRALLALPENKMIKRIDLSAPHAPIVK